MTEVSASPPRRSSTSARPRPGRAEGRWFRELQVHRWLVVLTPLVDPALPGAGWAVPKDTTLCLEGVRLSSPRGADPCFDGERGVNQRSVCLEFDFPLTSQAPSEAHRQFSSTILYALGLKCKSKFSMEAIEKSDAIHPRLAAAGRSRPQVSRSTWIAAWLCFHQSRRRLDGDAAR